MEKGLKKPSELELNGTNVLLVCGTEELLVLKTTHTGCSSVIGSVVNLCNNGCYMD